MAVRRAFWIALTASMGVLLAMRAQQSQMDTHSRQVTWTANLEQLATPGQKSFAMAEDSAGIRPSVKVSFTCDCENKIGTITVEAPDPKKITSVKLLRMRTPGDTSGPVILDVLRSKPHVSDGKLESQIPVSEFTSVSNVILNQQCMVMVTLAGPPGILAGPVVMHKAAM